MNIFYLVKTKVFKRYLSARKYMTKIKYPKMYVAGEHELKWLERMKKKNQKEDDYIQELINR
jgi:hypothetical protein